MFGEKEENKVRRIPTGIPEIDWLYGFTYINENNFIWGMPEGKLSLWAGAAGIGKSRAVKELAKSIANTKCSSGRSKGMYFTSDYCYLEGGKSVSLKDYIAHLRKTRPMVSILDSINQLEEFGGNGSDSSIKLIINGNKEQEGLRKVAEELKTHIILISQLTKNGEARGSSTLPHLVDIAFSANRIKEIMGINAEGIVGDDCFELKVGVGNINKHRYGRIGSEFKCFWRHYNDKALCISEHRLEDEIYCKHYKLQLKKTVTVDSIIQEEIDEQEEKIPTENGGKTLLRLLFGI